MQTDLRLKIIQRLGVSLIFKHCYSVDSIDSISVDTYPTDPIRSV